MSEESGYNYGVCGVYCGQCASGNGRLSFHARELRRLMEVYLRWLENEDVGFSYVDLLQGLEWISQRHCSCLDQETCFRGNRECALERGLRSCLECPEFSSCVITEYQRTRYPYVLESYEFVKEQGFPAWLVKEEKRACKGVDMCEHLFTN